MSDEMVTVDFQAARLMADLRRLTEKQSLRDIAAALGGVVSAATLSRLDNGNPPDMQTFLNLCAECDLNPGDYFKRVVWKRVDEFVSLPVNEPGKRAK
jgi:transcriptional regulator with XRE-family HTH domain